MKFCLVRSPMRVSLFGGGTDYPEYFNNKRGAVLGFSINKYIYFGLLSATNFLDYKYRLAYSILNTTKAVDGITHPIVAKALEHYDIDQPLDFSFQADLPASSGLGSSSSFSVGMIKIISELKNIDLSKEKIAEEAIFLDRVLMKESVGIQDHLHAAHGGINRFDFTKDILSKKPISLPTALKEELEMSILLVHTGNKRSASSIAKSQIENISKNKAEHNLEQIYQMVDEAESLIASSDPNLIKSLGSLLNEYWQKKKSISNKISGNEIDEIYELGIRLGAYGGKLCGAGGGGFLLFLIDKNKLEHFQASFGEDNCVQVKIDNDGVKTLYKD